MAIALWKLTSMSREVRYAAFSHPTGRPASVEGNGMSTSLIEGLEELVELKWSMVVWTRGALPKVDMKVVWIPSCENNLAMSNMGIMWRGAM